MMLKMCRQNLFQLKPAESAQVGASGRFFMTRLECANVKRFFSSLGKKIFARVICFPTCGGHGTAGGAGGRRGRLGPIDDFFRQKVHH